MKKLTIVWTLSIFLLSMIVNAATLIVDDDATACESGTTFHSIQNAMNAASNGDTIRVCPGTYNEAVTWNKTNISLIGTSGNRDDVLITQNSAKTISFSSWPQSVTIKNVTIESKHDDTIYVNNQPPTSGLFENVSIKAGKNGVNAVLYIKNFQLKNSYIKSNNDHGVYFGGYTNGKFLIEDSIIESKEDGINVNGTNGNIKIYNSNITSNIANCLEFRNSVQQGLELKNSTLQGDKGVHIIGNLNNQNLFQDVSIQSQDEAIQIEGSVSQKLNLKNIQIISQNQDGVEITGSLNGGLLIENSHITSNKSLGVLVNKKINNGISIKNSTITSYEISLDCKNNIAGDITIQNSSFTSQNEKGIFFEKNIHQKLTISNSTISSKDESFMVKGSINSGLLIDNVNMSSSAEDAINIKGNIFGYIDGGYSLSIKNSNIKAKKSALKLNHKKQIDLKLVNSSFESDNDDTVKLKLTNWKKIRVVGNCFKANGNGDYAFYLYMRYSHNVEIKNNCFYATAVDKLAKSKYYNSEYNWNGNYWDGLTGSSYNYNNVVDNNPLSSCSHSCGGNMTTTPQYDNRYSCGIFKSVLTSYDSIDSNANNDQACFTANISYPEGKLTGDIKCDPSGCGGIGSCERIDPPKNRYTATFPINSKSGTPNGSNPTDLTELKYGDLTYNNDTINFNPSNTYSDNNTKLMLLGNVTVSKSTLKFQPGDYYFDSLTITGNNNDVILPNGGYVRIFIKNDFNVSFNNLHFNTSGDQNDLFVYVGGDFNSIGNGGGTTSWKAFMYVKGTVTLNNNSNNWKIYGGITAEGKIIINGNNPDFIQQGSADNLGYGECKLCYALSSGGNWIGFGNFMNMHFNFPRTMAIINDSGETLQDVNVSQVEDTSIFSGTMACYKVVDENGEDANKPIHIDYSGFGFVSGNCVMGGLGDTNTTAEFDDYSSGGFENYYAIETYGISGSFMGNDNLKYYAVYKDSNDRLYNIELDYCTINIKKSYCEEHNLSTGFHVINPFNDVNKSFEIFCSNDTPKKDLIALPIKNEFNNFIFNSDNLSSNDYYSEAKNHSTPFHAIEIQIDTQNKRLNVITGTSKNPINHGNYNIMRKGFSNINLIGTPFAIDWSDTTLSNCNASKLRKGYHGQAVKINTLDYTKARCYINKMELKLLDDYRFLTYNSNEVLERTCKEMSEAIPESILPSDQIKGHFWIAPNNSDRDTFKTDITKADQRPFVAYCWFQPDLNYAWTFFLALDGKRTISKGDLTQKKDTCSQLGLWPFVPISEKTFERVRIFLKDNKNEWSNYTGTIEEKVNALYGNHYYLSTERNSFIWPYGSFGLYYDDHDGKHESNFKWGGEDFGSNPYHPGPMSGSPMHNIPTISSDYTHKKNDEGDQNRDYYNWTSSNFPQSKLNDNRRRYSTTDLTINDGTYEYKDTMGAKGWTTILGHYDLNKTDEWFISRTGAGLNFDHSSGSWPYFEPNGNYEEGCWLNFLYDSEGRVRHNDDWGCNYPYYDYMCMAEDNYDFVKRYQLIKGPFDVIEHNISSGQELTHRYIQTKVVNKPIELDIITLNESLDALTADRNLSTGIFLTKIETDSNGNENPQLLHFFGNISDFENDTGRFILLSNKNGVNVWPNHINKIDYAEKKMFIQFKYCGRDDYSWTDCWNCNLNTLICQCKTGKEQWCKNADSDFFAVRPDKFDFVIQDTPPYRAGKDYNITFYAKDYNGNPAQNYNETMNNSFKIDINETKTGCKKGIFNPDLNSSWQFANGEKSVLSNYSEAGKINIKINEINGSEFAIVDANDSGDETRLIKPYDQNITFTPDHFDIEAQLIPANDNNYTYISKDLNMSATLKLDVTAENEQNGTTENYNEACYAKETNYTISYIPDSIENLSKIIYQENSTQQKDADINGTLLLDFNFTIFSIEDNGSAHLTFKINFDRDKTKAVRPFEFNITSIIGVDEDNVTGSAEPNQTTHFYYARLHAPSEEINKIVGNEGDVKVYYEIYDPDGNNTGPLTNFKPSVDDIDWYINKEHNLNDGNITSILKKPNNIQIEWPPQGNYYSEGRENLHITYNGTYFPYIANIELNASNWLIFNKYNKDDDNITLRVKFISSGVWKGVGKTLKKQNEINITNSIERRINW